MPGLNSQATITCSSETERKSAYSVAGEEGEAGDVGVATAALSHWHRGWDNTSSIESISVTPHEQHITASLIHQHHQIMRAVRQQLEDIGVAGTAIPPASGL
jgi:hypothetical protein